MQSRHKTTPSLLPALPFFTLQKTGNPPLWRVAMCGELGAVLPRYSRIQRPLRRTQTRTRISNYRRLERESYHAWYQEESQTRDGGPRFNATLGFNAPVIDSGGARAPAARPRCLGARAPKTPGSVRRRRRRQRRRRATLPRCSRPARGRGGLPPHEICARRPEAEDEERGGGRANDRGCSVHDLRAGGGGAEDGGGRCVHVASPGIPWSASRGRRERWCFVAGGARVPSQ
jgi:hypothetical protein